MIRVSPFIMDTSKDTGKPGNLSKERDSHIVFKILFQIKAMNESPCKHAYYEYSDVFAI